MGCGQRSVMKNLVYSFEVAVAVNSDSIVTLVRHFLALLHCHRNHKKATDHMQRPPPQFATAVRFACLCQRERS